MYALIYTKAYSTSYSYSGTKYEDVVVAVTDSIHAANNWVAEKSADDYDRNWKKVPFIEYNQYDDHVYCRACGECTTCNLRPCREGKEHTK